MITMQQFKVDMLYKGKTFKSSQGSDYCQRTNILSGNTPPLEGYRPTLAQMAFQWKT